ncbi:uncharacterized protein LOC131248975 [Magnolia sinica]|uniref:uncharacterized protein LOC131248975 n=1 Tax=Magnolia sinica TaxID=86752 RepID=UPI00265A2553|nr:uncharacterized protein LOC131248975 [Magnolia sinica]
MEVRTSGVHASSSVLSSQSPHSPSDYWSSHLPQHPSTLHSNGRPVAAHQLRLLFPSAHGEETLNHLICSSLIVAMVWSYFQRIFYVPVISNQTIQQKISLWMSKPSPSSCLKRLLGLAPALISWEIWLSRNASHFNGIQMSAQNIIFWISRWMQEIVNPLPDSALPPPRDVATLQALHLDCHKVCFGAMPEIVKWTRPPPGWFKLNVDGSSCQNPGESGGGGVLRDAHGRVIFAFHRYYGLTANTVAEAQAMLDGITLYRNLGLSSIVVESDSSVVVEAAADPNAHCP